jgi:hypothetical protein
MASRRIPQKANRHAEALSQKYIHEDGRKDSANASARQRAGQASGQGSSMCSISLRASSSALTL